MRMRLTAQFLYHLWSEGTTYHGAWSVEVWFSASSYAIW
jgi:hypothetical protein